jgi:hypothetical protein
MYGPYNINKIANGVSAMVAVEFPLPYLCLSHFHQLQTYNSVLLSAVPNGASKLHVPIKISFIVHTNVLGKFQSVPSTLKGKKKLFRTEAYKGYPLPDTAVVLDVCFDVHYHHHYRLFHHHHALFQFRLSYH